MDVQLQPQAGRLAGCFATRREFYCQAVQLLLSLEVSQWGSLVALLLDPQSRGQLAQQESLPFPLLSEQCSPLLKPPAVGIAPPPPRPLFRH